MISSLKFFCRLKYTKSYPLLYDFKENIKFTSGHPRYYTFQVNDRIEAKWKRQNGSFFENESVANIGCHLNSHSNEIHQNEPHSGSQQWTKEEEEKLQEAVKKFGRQWKTISADIFGSSRTRDSLKKKHISLSKKDREEFNLNERENHTENVTSRPKVLPNERNQTESKFHKINQDTSFVPPNHRPSKFYKYIAARKQKELPNYVNLEAINQKRKLTRWLFKKGKKSTSRIAHVI
ncbi:hypothetical protein G9A89_007269 [Geosiphon pyriformis]|nr:hypothetical protein G9A89_007269 [Geosiphon pyriformis]